MAEMFTVYLEDNKGRTFTYDTYSYAEAFDIAYEYIKEGNPKVSIENGDGDFILAFNRERYNKSK